MKARIGLEDIAYEYRMGKPRAILTDEALIEMYNKAARRFNKWVQTHLTNGTMTNQLIMNALAVIQSKKKAQNAKSARRKGATKRSATGE